MAQEPITGIYTFFFSTEGLAGTFSQDALEVCFLETGSMQVSLRSRGLLMGEREHLGLPCLSWLYLTVG